MASVIYHSNDNVVSIASLTNGMTAAAVTGATVTLSLLTSAGAAVTGATGITMVATTGAASTYRGTVPYTVSLTTGGSYTAKIVVTAGALHGQWEVPVTAVERTG